MLLLRRLPTKYTSRSYSGVIRNFLFGRNTTVENSDLPPASAARSVELANLSADDVDAIMEQVLLKQGLNQEDSLGNLKSKFDVLSEVEKQFSLKIPSCQLNTLHNGQDIKEFILYNQERMQQAAKLFTIDMTSLPENLSIKQPTLRVGPKKHKVKDSLDPDSYEHPM